MEVAHLYLVHPHQRELPDRGDLRDKDLRRSYRPGNRRIETSGSNNTAKLEETASGLTSKCTSNKNAGENCDNISLAVVETPPFRDSLTVRTGMQTFSAPAQAFDAVDKDVANVTLGKTVTLGKSKEPSKPRESSKPKEPMTYETLDKVRKALMQLSDSERKAIESFLYGGGCDGRTLSSALRSLYSPHSSNESNSSNDLSSPSTDDVALNDVASINGRTQEDQRASLVPSDSREESNQEKSNQEESYNHSAENYFPFEALTFEEVEEEVTPEIPRRERLLELVSKAQEHKSLEDGK